MGCGASWTIVNGESSNKNNAVISVGRVNIDVFAFTTIVKHVWGKNL